MRIKQLREMHGMQQKELASIIGISPNTLSQYENGKREPGLEIIAKLSDYFNVSSDFIYGLSDLTKCNKCGLEFCPLIKSDIEVHAELHQRWEKAVKKHGIIYAAYTQNEKIKATNRNIVENTKEYSLIERYTAQLEVFRCLFSRSLSAVNYNENHVDFATYISMLLNQEHTKKSLDSELYKKFTDEYGTTTGIPYGTYFDPNFHLEKHLHTIAAHFDGDKYTEDELEEINQFAEFVKNKRK